MIIDLTGRLAVVSGSTAGIGYAIAHGLARTGAEVVINGRSDASVQSALKRLRDAVPGATFAGIAADLGTAEGIETFVSKVPTPDILVNNLGIFDPKPFMETSDEDWEQTFRINVMSGVRMSRHYLGAMKERGWGRVIFISSEAGVQIPVEMIHYGVTKCALLALARGLAEEAIDSGVTVNSVVPGPTRSEGVERFVADMARSQCKTVDEVEREFFTIVRPSSLIKRFATVQEVASMVVYACSEQASATTGAALRVDGGVVQSIL